MYYAKTNTADPAVGFISAGDALTKAQEAALGAEKLAEMTRRGTLARTEGPASPAPAGPEAGKGPDGPEARKEPEAAQAGEPEDADAGLPELDITDDMVGEAPPKKGGRRRSK